jgi:hypothetical protein
MIDNFDVIVVTADEPYSGMSHTQILYTNFFSKQKTVLYVEPPLKWRPWNILRLFKRPVQQHSNLFLHTYVNALPSKLKIGKALNEHLNDAVTARFLKKRKAKKTLIWHFDSYRSVLNSTAMQAQSQLQHIYHVIDPFYNNPVDAALRVLSNPVVITSPRNNRFYENVSSKIINVPQCIDLDAERKHLKKNLTAPLNNYIVLLGTISDDTDFELLIQIAASEIPLLLIGKKVDFKKKQVLFDQLIACGSVRYLGFLPPKDFYPLLQKASAGIIAYDLTIRSRSFSPLKAINYLIANLPVISNCDTELPTLQSKGIYETALASEYLSHCKKALTANLKVDTKFIESYLEGVSLQAAVSNILQKIE